MQPIQILQQLLDAALLAFNDNPVILSLQAGIVVAGVMTVYLLAYTVRDIILRSRSVVYQLACILLVAALPIVGFFLYLLIRPARTVQQRQMEKMLKEILSGEKKIVNTFVQQSEHGFTAKKVAEHADKKKGNLLHSLGKKSKASVSA